MDRKTWRLLWGIFALALFVRAAILITTFHTPFLANMVQGNEAMNLVLGRGLVITEYADFSTYTDSGRPVDPEKYRDLEPSKVDPYLRYHMPGPAFVLAALFKLTGKMTYVVSQVFYGLLDAFGVFLLFFCARRVFGIRVALWSSLLYAVRIPYAVMATSLTREAPLSFLGLLILFGFVKFYENPSWRWGLLIGIVCGVSTFFRPEFYMLAYVLTAAGFVMAKSFGRIKALVIMAGVFVVLAPWISFNKAKYNRTIITQQLKWPSVWSALGEMKNDFGAVNYDGAVKQYAEAQGNTDGYFTFEFDDFFKERVHWVVRERFGWLVKLGLVRAVKIPLLRNYWGFKDTEEEKFGYRYSGMSLMEYASRYPGVFAKKIFGSLENLTLHLLGLWGLVIAYRKMKVPALLLFAWMLPFLFNYGIHVLSGVDSRYMLWSSVALLPLAVSVFTTRFGANHAN